MNRIDQLKQTLVSLESLRSQSARRFLAEMEFAEGLAKHEARIGKEGFTVSLAPHAIVSVKAVFDS